MSTPTRTKTIAITTTVLLALAGVGRAGANETTSLALDAMDAAVVRFIEICADLGGDKADTIARHVRALGSALAAVDKVVGTDADTKKVGAMAREAAGVIAANSTDLRSGDNARVRKHLFALAKPFGRYVGWFHAGGKRWRTYFCQMAKASWLQPASVAKLANPYYCKKMLGCGDSVRTRGE